VGKLTLSTTTRTEILSRLEDDTPEREAIRRRAPRIATVTLCELVRPRSSRNPVPERVPLARGTRQDASSEAIYRDVESVDLYDLGDIGRVDVIRVGRHPSQDLQVLDNVASREHGLVLFDSIVYFYDYGTNIGPDHPDHPVRVEDRPPGRHGSRNGSYLNRHTLIRNGMIPWNESDTIHFGTQHGPRRDYGFKLRLDLPPAQN